MPPRSCSAPRELKKKEKENFGERSEFEKEEPKHSIDLVEKGDSTFEVFFFFSLHFSVSRSLAITSLSRPSHFSTLFLPLTRRWRLPDQTQRRSQQ